MAVVTSNATARWRWAPWTDARGGLSWPKLLVFLGLLTPAVLLLVDAMTASLGPRPIEEAIHRTGWWAVTFVILSLAVTPVSRVSRWAPLVTVRRMVGVTAFLAAALHVTLYVVEQDGVLAVVVKEIATRWYLVVGTIALLGLAGLAATSTDGMARRLGGARWRALHKLAYPIGALAILHFFMQVKGIPIEPVLYAALFVWLMAWRLWRWRAEGEPGAIVLLGLTLGATVIAALGEAVAITAKAPVPFARVLAANLDPDLALDRPAVWVLAMGVAITAIGWWRGAGKRR